jgi:GxxExxY protein
VDGEGQDGGEQKRGEGAREAEGCIHGEQGFTDSMPAGRQKVGRRAAKNRTALCRLPKGCLIGRKKAQKAQKKAMNSNVDIFALCDQVRETSFALHRFLRHGHLEKVYENGLANRLRKTGRTVLQQHPLQICDEDGAVLGDYLADLVIEHKLVVELKAVKTLADEHVAQLLGYLRSSGYEHGLLINFGAPKLEIRKYALSR